MWIKVYKPYTPSRRFMTGYTFDEITTDTPYKPLTAPLKSTAWRNSQGRITVRFRWGGHKKLYRILDFKGYDKMDIPGVVSTIEYDPNRTARIALITYKDWEKRYVLAWNGIKVWDEIRTWESAKLAAWNRKLLKDIPDGFTVYAMEVLPNSKWKLLRSAWCFATVKWRDEQTATVYLEMPSWEVRRFHEKCWATIWMVWNDEHKNIVIWKAWRNRWLWRKPNVLGKSMNPVDHPHWGWEWHSPIGLVSPKSHVWKPVPLGKKTRKSKWSDKFIVSRRNKK